MVTVRLTYTVFIIMYLPSDWHLHSGLPSGVLKLRPSTFKDGSSGPPGDGDGATSDDAAAAAEAKAASLLAATRQPTAYRSSSKTPLRLTNHRNLNHPQSTTFDCTTSAHWSQTVLVLHGYTVVILVGTASMWTASQNRLFRIRNTCWDLTHPNPDACS